MFALVCVCLSVFDGCSLAPVPPSVYEQLIRRCYDGKRGGSNRSSVKSKVVSSGTRAVVTASSVEARKQVALEAFKMYWSDAVEGQGLPPAHQILYKLIEVSHTKKGSLQRVSDHGS